MCMWNGEWKQCLATPDNQASEGGQKCICCEWLLIFFVFISFFYCQGRLYSSTIINFIHRNNMKFPMLFFFFHSYSSRKNNNISQAHNKSIFYCTTLPGLERKPIIDGIINVINLHNQYLFRSPEDTCRSSTSIPIPKTTWECAMPLKMISVFALCAFFVPTPIPRQL